MWKGEKVKDTYDIIWQSVNQQAETSSQWKGKYRKQGIGNLVELLDSGGWKMDVKQSGKVSWLRIYLTYLIPSKKECLLTEPAGSRFPFVLHKRPKGLPEM